MVQKTDYDHFAQEITAAVGGPGNITQVTHCTTRLRFQLKDVAKVDKERIATQPESLGLVEASGGVHVIVGMTVPAAHAALAKIPGVNTGGDTVPADAVADRATAAGAKPEQPAKKPRVIDRVLGTLSAIFTPYIPLLASAGIIQGVLALVVQFNWLSTDSSTYTVLAAAGTSVIYFFPVLLAFTAAKQFDANPYIGATIGATLLYPDLATLTTSGSQIEVFGIPFTAQSFGSTVIPILLGMWAYSYLEKGLKRVLPQITHLLLVPTIGLVVMVPAMLVVFGPVGFGIANGVSVAYTWLLQYPLILSLVFGGFFVFVIAIGAHWVITPLLLQILATNGKEYALAAGGMGNYAMLGVLLAVLLMVRNTESRQVAGSAAFVNAVAGVTEPGLYGVIIKNKRYLGAVVVGGLVGGLICGLFDVYVTAFAFSGILGSPAFLASPRAVPYFIAVFATIIVSFALTVVLERLAQRRRGARQTEEAVPEPVLSV